MNDLGRRKHHLRARADVLDALHEELYREQEPTKPAEDWGSSSEQYHINKAGEHIPLGTFRLDDPAYKV